MKNEQMHALLLVHFELVRTRYSFNCINKLWSVQKQICLLASMNYDDKMPMTVKKNWSEANAFKNVWRRVCFLALWEDYWRCGEWRDDASTTYPFKTPAITAGRPQLRGSAGAGKRVEVRQVELKWGKCTCRYELCSWIMNLCFSI